MQEASQPLLWMPKGWGWRLLLLVLVLALLFVVDLSLGAVAIPYGSILEILTGTPAENKVWEQILWEFRLPKALTALAAGSALAVSGLQMQTLFRNPLAGPFVLGISSGASLGVAVLLMAGSIGWLIVPEWIPWLTAGAAALGAAGVLVLIFLAALRLQDSMALLILGLMVGSLAGAVVSVLQFYSGAEKVQAYMIWTFGSLGGVTWPELQVVLPVVVVGLVLAQALAKPLNALLLGERYASSVGVSMGKVRPLILISTSLLAGSITAFCGPIAFVGLAVPHLCRLLFHISDHRLLLPVVMLGGAILLLLCDILANILAAGGALPLNAITTLFGAPVVLWLILRQRAIGKMF
ncbi:iron ABC transporter permease [Cesiribacter sp. SM1]|uniref:iron ABC transporter permease n=1 Tax=Cesiribacter sp. SM1 TaxID=2861196 RepID=UPI001CD35490|nr:iron ABC transporter permease [Cesiribacter sp. SM1]